MTIFWYKFRLNISTLIEQLYFCRIVRTGNKSSSKSIMFVRVTVYSAIILLIFSACTTQRQSSSGQNSGNSRSTVVNKDPKFLDDISIAPGSNDGSVYTDDEKKESKKPDNSTKANRKKDNNKREAKKRNSKSSNDSEEKAAGLQVKYAALLNTDVEEVRDLRVYEYIDEWYGTKYCMGGNTKNCTDCSGFVQNFFFSMYGANLPRTAREQYSFGTKISTAKLRQGDLLFYNTRGGVSHVGIYLQNNKFVHASTNNGVMISDMADAYYAKRFIGARRVNKEIETTGGR